ncbi:MAG: glycosyltransferase family 2 protein [Chloroflexi bacterium]|nr:glycosyltransferase family 2 protein [Chloroflexota bacterium]
MDRQRLATSLTVSLPAYNEEGNIGQMVDRVRNEVGPLVDDLEIIVVDDGSRDRTAEVVEGIARQDPRVRLIRHSVNQGYGAAVYTGVWSASKDLIFFTDSDLQFTFAELPEFLKRIDGIDMVIGWRRTRSDPWYRRLFGNGWSWLVNLLFGHTARDVDCAYKLFRREVIERIDVASRGATFSAEFLVRARQAGFRVIELPVNHHPRVAGKQTGARPEVVLRAFRELMQLRNQLRRERAA